MEGIGYLKRKLVIDTYASFRIVVFVESNSSVNSQFMLLFFLIKKKSHGSTSNLPAFTRVKSFVTQTQI